MVFRKTHKDKPRPMHPDMLKEQSEYAAKEAARKNGVKRLAEIDAENLKRWGILHPGHVVDPNWLKAYEKTHPHEPEPKDFDSQLDDLVRDALAPLVDEDEIAGGVCEDFRVEKDSQRVLAEGIRTLINEVLDVVCEVTDHTKFPTDTFWEKLPPKIIGNFLKRLDAAHDCAISGSDLFDSVENDSLKYAGLKDSVDRESIMSVFESATLMDQEAFIAELQDCGAIPDPLTLTGATK